MAGSLRRLTRLTLFGVAVGALSPERHLKRMRRRLARRGARWFSYLEGRLEGTKYRWLGMEPDPTIEGALLADRVRSALGPLEKRLDVPRVHVMAEGHTVLLHGEVSSDDDAEVIERAVLDISGVDGLRSFLHIGLGEGDTRPSAGRSHQPYSKAYQRLVGAAREAAVVDDATARRIARATLATLVTRLPAGERAHVLAHLPTDARALAEPRMMRWDGAPIDTTADLELAVSSASGEWRYRVTDGAVRAVLTVLQDLVPEEVTDIAAVLPEDLRALWPSTAVQRVDGPSSIDGASSKASLR